ncbi:dipeptidyl aminopeptidase V [Melampsora larici-populina 98AG31]|uniref:Dipeptidyl-peptidase V n=1 Tax=Melampsora larici-populina (strain 98AG31 / pathotype 3-4-7) TaxID=747676 RepID=F4RTH0_MELLP|nr:dipeptidyl aminopeptidase V [Melampsora larici-populina 98AG31]EGG04338.1 dipeptidyl aminopeptidase V [Melampsora larici-populina 98AG31]
MPCIPTLVCPGQPRGLLTGTRLHPRPGKAPTRTRHTRGRLTFLHVIDRDRIKMDAKNDSPELDPISLSELPRINTYIPNQNGTKALVFITKYNHKQKQMNRSLQFIELQRETPNHELLIDNLVYTEAIWIDSNTILYLRPPGSSLEKPDLDPTLDTSSATKELNQRLDSLPNNEGKLIELWAINLEKKTNEKAYENYLVGKLPTTISDLQSISLSKTSAILAFFAEVYAPYDHESIKKVDEIEKLKKDEDDGSSGMVYDALFVRRWDTWMNPHGKSSRVYFTQLSLTENLQWSLSSDSTFYSPFPNLTVPNGPLGDGSDFDLSGSSIVVTSKDPNLNPAWHTRQNIYVVPLFPKHKEDGRIVEVTMGDQGATSNPVFSPSAKSNNTRDKGKLAWLEMRIDGYESDRNRVMIYDFETRRRYCLTKHWDRSPSRIIWGKDDTEIFLTAQEHGRVKAFRLPVKEDSKEMPISLTKENSISNLSYLPTSTPESTNLLLTTSSLNSLNSPSILNLSKNQDVSLMKLNSFETLGLDGLDDAEHFWFEGAEEVKVHGIFIRPPGFKKGVEEKWPLLFLIHGGPQSAWNDSWGLRWNANAFASAGYLVAMINPSGSTGFGQEFTDSINQQWGGKPYKDLAAGYQYILDHYPEIDSNRTAALGASYGGYMVNWLMGHNNSPFNFKAFVSHDGILNTISTYFATDEIYFPEHEFGGTAIHKKEVYEKWNPLNFVGNWKTPCLVIHSRFDYRLPESEGISVFNSLQRQGIPSKLLYFPDENHWVSKSANLIRWYKEIFKFLDEWCPAGVSSSVSGSN